MDKVFGALERLKTAPSFMGGTVQYMFSTNSVSALLEDYELVKQALLELKAIKEANPSEALEELEKFTDLYDTRYNRFYINVHDTVEQALLKAQEQEEELANYKDLLEEYDIKPHQIREAFVMFKMSENKR